MMEPDLKKWFPERPVVMMPWEIKAPVSQKSKRPYHTQRARIKELLQTLYPDDDPTKTHTIAAIVRVVQMKIPGAKRDTVVRAMDDLGWNNDT